jgi:hypothetical protein
MTGSEILRSAHVVRNQAGQAEAVQLSIEAWSSLLDWIEDLEDRAVIKQALTRLRSGPVQSRALDWDQVGSQWLEEPAAE